MGRRAFALLLVHCTLFQAVTFVLRPTATYRALELDVPAGWVGVLAATFAVVPLIVAVPSGNLVDRYGERSVMFAGSLLLSAAGCAFVLIGRSVAGIVVATALLGVAHLCCAVSQQALVANRTPSARYDNAFGRYTFAVSLGQALGPGLIVLFGGNRPIPDTASIFIGATLLTAPLFLLSIPLKPSSYRLTRHDAGGALQLLRRPGLAPAIVVSSALMAAIDISLAYLPALGAQRGIASGVVGVLLALRALSSMVARLFLGPLARAVGRRRLLLTTMAFSAAGLGGLALPLPTVALGVLILIAGVGLGAGQPLTMSWLAESTSPGLRGRAMSLRLTGNRLGQVLIPSVAGLVAAATGAAGVFAVTAGSVAAAMLAGRVLRLPTAVERSDAAAQPLPAVPGSKD